MRRKSNYGILGKTAALTALSLLAVFLVLRISGAPEGYTALIYLSVLGAWTVYFIISLLRQYNSESRKPSELNAVLEPLGFDMSMRTGREIYIGRYDHCPVRIELTRSTRGGELYIFFLAENYAELTVGKSDKAFQTRDVYERLEYLPSEITHLHIFAPDPEAAHDFLRDGRAASALREITDKVDTEFYWEREQLVIHAPYVNEPEQVIYSLERLSSLRQL